MYKFISEYRGILKWIESLYIAQRYEYFLVYDRINLEWFDYTMTEATHKLFVERNCVLKHYGYLKNLASSLKKIYLIRSKEGGELKYGSIQSPQGPYYLENS